MKIPNRMLTRAEVADLLGVEPKTVDNYVKQGILKKNTKIPGGKFNPVQIAELCDIDLETFSVFIYKKTLKELEEAKQENEYLKNQIKTVKKVLEGA